MLTVACSREGRKDGERRSRLLGGVPGELEHGETSEHRFRFSTQSATAFLDPTDEG